MTSFNDFMNIREAAASAYCHGRADEVLTLSTSQEPASFFGPDGNAVSGAIPVKENYAAAASHFGPNGSNEFEILHKAERRHRLLERVAESRGRNRRPAGPHDAAHHGTLPPRRWRVEAGHRHADMLKAAQ